MYFKNIKYFGVRVLSLNPCYYLGPLFLSHGSLKVSLKTCKLSNTQEKYPINDFPVLPKCLTYLKELNV